MLQKSQPHHHHHHDHDQCPLETESHPEQTERRPTHPIIEAAVHHHVDEAVMQHVPVGFDENMQPVELPPPMTPVKDFDVDSQPSHVQPLL